MKTILRILCFLLPFSLTATTARSEITKQQAIDFVMDSIVGDQADSMNVYMEGSIQVQSYYVISPYDSILSPYQQYWLFFIDLKPEYLWAHDCWYVFLDNATGENSVVTKRLPPVGYPSVLETVSIPIVFSPECPDFDIEYDPPQMMPENDNLYAVMFTGGDGTESCMFWNALSHMYCGLREHGFPKENIYVLSANGLANGMYNPSLDLDNDKSPIPDIKFNKKCNKENLQSIFTELTTKMDLGDLLYVFVVTHGDTGIVNNIAEFILFNNQHLLDDELATMVSPINCSQMIFNLFSCFSGGFTEELLGMNTPARKTVITCTDTRAYPRPPAFNQILTMDRYPYLICTALRGWHPDRENHAPWNVTYTVGDNPNFFSIFNEREANYDLAEFGGNGDGIQEIHETMEYVADFDGVFHDWGSKEYHCGFHQGDEMQPAEDVLSIFGITGKVYHSQTVHGDFLIGGRLSVEPGVELTLDNTTTFHVFNSEIIVKPRSEFPSVDGAKLIIDGGKMTSAGENMMWKGIEVWGNPNLSQIPASNQGSLWIINNGEIRNAWTGVLVGKGDCEIGKNLVVCSTGGFVHGENARFINNKTACMFGPYQGINHSTFTKCDFLTDAALVDGSNPVHFVYLEGIQPVSFNGCTFMNSRNLIEAPYQNRGTAIFSENSEIFINPVCLDMGNPCVNKRPTKFEKMTRGVYAMNSGAEHSVLINEAEFLDNHMGLYLSGFGGVSASEVLSSKFRGAPYSEFSYGMYLNECSGYHVENNEFYENIQITPISIGLIVNNSGPYSNEIYRNIFHNLKYATLSQNNNRNGNLEGLCYKCNKFVKEDGTEPNKYDFMITYDPNTYNVNTGIAKDQGSDDYPAANMFLNDPVPPVPYHYDFWNDGNHVEYFYHSTNPTNFRLEPYPHNIRPDNSVDPNISDAPYTENTCRSKLEGGGLPDGDVILLTEAENKSDSLEALLTTLIDGGSTSLLNFEVSSSTPPEALQTRNELIAGSPYLSDTVMKTSITKEDVLDNSMIRDVLVANPHSAKSDEIIGMLENRTIPMPDYLMEQILAGADTIGVKEVLETNRTWWNSEGDQSYVRLLNYYKGDSVSPPDEDSLAWLFSFHTTLSSHYDKAVWQSVNGFHEQAMTTLAETPELFSLSPLQLEVNSAYIDFYELLEQLSSDTVGIFKIDSTSASSLQEIANTNTGFPSTYARNLLIANGIINYQEPIILPDTSLKSGKKSKFKGVKEDFKGSSLTVYPNPARDYFIVKFNLNYLPENAMINLRNEKGIRVYSKAISRSEDQQLIQITHLTPGIYILNVESEGKSIESVKIVIAN